jgi:helicase required for RNAi-mediated heterochromatin assembly 1
MIVGFVDYLTLNGVDASKITLLTFYNGQRKHLLRELYGHKNCNAISAVKVVTVDGYQGTQFFCSVLVNDLSADSYQAKRMTLLS